MSKTFSRLLFVWLFAVSPAFADPTCTSKQLSEAFHFMKQLEEKSPKYHGHSLRRYALEDISSEGCVDVVERINEPEEKELGLMSDALWDGFEWIKIYSFRNGKFLETTDKHYQFLIKRKRHYEHWLRLLANPTGIKEGNQYALQEPRLTRLEETLKSYLERINKMLKKSYPTMPSSGRATQRRAA